MGIEPRVQQSLTANVYKLKSDSFDTVLFHQPPVPKDCIASASFRPSKLTEDLLGGRQLRLLWLLVCQLKFLPKLTSLGVSACSSRSVFPVEACHPRIDDDNGSVPR